MYVKTLSGICECLCLDGCIKNQGGKEVYSHSWAVILSGVIVVFSQISRIVLVLLFPPFCYWLYLNIFENWQW